MAGISDSLEILGGVLDGFEKGGDSEVAKREKESMNGIIDTNGNINKLLNDFTVEPNIVVSENASYLEITDHVSSLALDIFAAYYMQAYEVLVNLHGISNKSTLKLLSTDNGVHSLGRKIGKSLSSALTRESSVSARDEETGDVHAITLSLNLEDELTTEASLGINDKFKSISERSDAILQRNLEIKINTTTNGKEVKKISIPITVRASVYKVSLSSLLIRLEDKKTINRELRFLEYKAGMKSKGDLLLSNDLIKSYMQKRIRDKKEFHDMLARRRNSSMAKVLSTGARGFEQSYNSYIITDEDRIKIESEISKKLYDKHVKNEILETLQGLSIFVIDSDEEVVTVLNSATSGNSIGRFKDIKKSKGKNETSELTELFKAMVSGRSLF